MKWLATAVFVCVTDAKPFAQNFACKDSNPGRLVDEVFAIQDIDINYQDLYENFLQLASNPLNLNLVTEEQLSSLYLLSHDEIISILKYRAEAGPFISVLELQTLLNRESFLKLIPFVIVPDATQSFNKNIFKRVVIEQNNYLLLRWGKTLEHQRGYAEKATPSNHYVGSQDNIYARFRTSRSGDFSLGFTIKKDAGEDFAWNASKKYYGFDYLSLHLQTLNKGKVKNLIVGDYQAQFGQGITLGSAFGIGKNGEPVSLCAGPISAFSLTLLPMKLVFFVALHFLIRWEGR